ncbi:MAG: hypothetical protein HY332_08665 [Chloroflexi bacterium]|nr:hypothetical protein [Chloroflexota bacterium]
MSGDSSYSTLVSALQSPDALVALLADDPLAAARLRGLQARERLLQTEGGTLTAGQVAKLLGVTQQAVDKRRRAGRLLALNLGRRGSAYPAWQFGPDGVLDGFEAVLAALAVSPWTQASWFLSGDVRLGGETPLAALRRGNVDAVQRAARASGEHSAA